MGWRAKLSGKFKPQSSQVVLVYLLAGSGLEAAGHLLLDNFGRTYHVRHPSLK